MMLQSNNVLMWIYADLQMLGRLEYNNNNSNRHRYQISVQYHTIVNCNRFVKHYTYSSNKMVLCSLFVHSLSNGMKNDTMSSLDYLLNWVWNAVFKDWLHCHMSVIIELCYRCQHSLEKSVPELRLASAKLYDHWPCNQSSNEMVSCVSFDIHW